MFARSIYAGLFLALTIATAAAGPNCTCRFQGTNFQIGEVACILGKLKRCEMQLNNTSWKTLTDGCPQAALQISRTPLSNAVDVMTGSRNLQ